MARKSTSGQPEEPAGKPGDVPEDVDVTPAADESAKADDVAAADADAVDETEPEAEPEAEAEAEEAEAEPEEPEAEPEDEEAEAGLADALFDLNDEDTDEVRQPVRKLTKAPVKKAQASRKRAATTAPTTTGRTTPWAFVRQAIGELRKVVWPSGDTVGQYFIVVLVFVLFVMFVVFGLDTLFGWGLMRIFR